jgi:hypothetical protein
MLEQFTTKLKSTGHLYIPKKIGSVKVTWNRAHDIVSIAVTPNPGGVDRRLYYILPPSICRISFHRRSRSSIKIVFYRCDGFWSGCFKLCRGWDTLKL